MAAHQKSGKSQVSRFLHSWQAPAAAGLLLLIGMAFWLAPRQVDRVVPVDDSTSWVKDDAPPRREIVWQTAREIPSLFSDDEQAELVTPKLSTDGTALYFSRRIEGRQSDIYVSRLQRGTWQPAQPVAELNTNNNEVGPVLSPDGKQLYFYSDRSGGLGGTDIYVATRQGNGKWGKPKNLGPKVNSNAHEYDPAISPDGKSLYFASNRTDETAERIAADKQPAKQEWNVTLRAQFDLTQFDIYRARRDDAKSDWGPSAALEQINRPDSSEGSPFVSPNGAFLYFASDRTARNGERRNLDLYRARLAGDTFQNPENLGPSINTSDHESEPGLSAEGFTIVFASDRDGTDQLYASTATEIYHDSEWDASRLQSLSIPGWWWMLWVAAILAAILLPLIYFRNWLYQKVWPARFFLGSVLVNLLVLLLLAIWTLPEVFEAIVSTVEEVVPAPEFVDDNQHQSHEDGREAHEKVADLKSVEPVPIPKMVRKVTNPLSVPERTERLVPTIPVEQARALPPDRVRFVAPQQIQQPELKQQPQESQLARRRSTQPQLPAMQRELVELPPDLEAVEAPQNDAVAKVDVNVVRGLNEQPPADVVPQKPNLNPLARMRPAAAAVAEIRPAEEAPSLPVKLPQQKIERETTSRPLDAVAVVDAPKLEAAAVNPTNDPVMDAAQPKVDRAPSALNNPASFSKPDNPLPPPSLVRRQMQVQQAAVKLPDGESGSDPTPAPLERNRPAVEVAGVTVTSETLVPKIDAADIPQEMAIATADIELKRATPVSPKAGLGAVAERPMTAERPAVAARPIAVAAANFSPPLTETAQSDEPNKDPLSRVKRELAADLTPSDKDPNEPELVAAVVESKLKFEAKEITVAKAEEAVPDPPAAPVIENQPKSTPAKAERQQLQIAKNDAADRPMTPEQVAAPFQRTTPRVPVTVTPIDEKTDQPVELAAVERPQEAAAQNVEIALLRTTEPPLDTAVPTPQELTGPVTRIKHRVEVGELSTERNDAPPAFSPLANRLDRQRAKATRVALAEDNVGLQSLFTLRQGETRKKYIDLLGGTKESEKAVNRGLAWLAKHQEKDGSWDLKKHSGSEKSNTAGTGFGLLPFLAAGYTHNKPGQYQKTVTAAIDWLLTNQKENGDLLGPGDRQHMYSHGIAAIALCEAYGMSRDEKLEQPARKALEFIVSAQHQGSGGWRYNPNQPADTSVVGWQMMALKSGEMAGLKVEKKVYDNVVRWLNSVEAKQGVSGTFGYTSRGASPAMSAEGLLSLQFLRIDRNSPRVRNGADFLLTQLPEVKQKRSSYYWYYGTQVMYHMQGKYWDAWNENLRDILVETQLKSGKHAGTWHPRDSYEKRGGRVYATSLKLLMLEVYYRHLPLYEQLEN